MMKRRLVLGLTLALGATWLFIGTVGIAWAAPSGFALWLQQDEGLELGEAGSRLAQQLAISIGVATAHVIAKLAWFVTRFLLAIFEIVLDTQWSLELVNTTLAQIQATMPQILQNIMLGQNGFIYLALAVAGITMVFPFLMRGSPVRVDRVFIWSALILGLFATSEAVGYNIIALFEGTRVSLLSSILGMENQDVQGALTGLVLDPWRATPAEAQLDLEFRLPQAFQTAFFPEPVESDEVVLVARAWWSAKWKFETPESLERRRDGAFKALFWSFVGLYGVIVLGFVAFASAALTLASLLLIVLFLATLPLALFSFGEALVLRVVHRWMGVVAATLFLGVFLRLASGWTSTLSLAGGEVAVVVTWFIWMTLLLIVFVKFAHLALDLFTSSLLLIGSIASAVFGSAHFVEAHGSTHRVGYQAARVALLGANLASGFAASKVGAFLLRPGATGGTIVSLALAGGLPTVAPFGAVAGEALYRTGIWTGRMAYRAGRWAVRRALRGAENVFMAMKP